MYFLRKKKRQRDLDAGLIFQWRGARKHHLGKVVALIMVAGFFAFSVYALRIETPKAPLLSKQEGVVIMLNESDPNCHELMMRIEAKSPFPVRWDPVFDTEIMSKLATEVMELAGPQWQYDSELMPLPVQKSSYLRPSIIEPSSGLLGLVMNNDWQDSEWDLVAEPRGSLSIRSKVSASGDIEERLPENGFALPMDLIGDDLFGQSMRFMVGLDSAGAVQSCFPLPGGTLDGARPTERQENIAAWLRQQRFEKAVKGDGLATGELELQIEASRE